MSEPEDRGEAARGRRHARPSSGDAGDQGGQDSWPSRYGPRPDFTLPPDTADTRPGDDAPPRGSGRHSSGPADRDWFGDFSGGAQPREGNQLDDRTESYDRTQSYDRAQPYDGAQSYDGQPYDGAQPPGNGSGDVTRSYRGTRRSGRPDPAADPYAQHQPQAQHQSQPQPGRRRRPDSQDTPPPSAPRARQSPSDPWPRPDQQAPSASADPRAQQYQPDPGGGSPGQPAGYTGREGRGADPADYDFDRRDGYAGRGDPYAERDGYAGRGDSERDGYAGRGDPERDRYAGRPADQAEYGDSGPYAQRGAGPDQPGPRGRAPADPGPQWDGEDGYREDDRFVPGLGGRQDEYDDYDEYENDGASGRGGRGGRSGRGGRGGSDGTGKRRRRWLIPLVVIIVILLIPLAVGGFFAYRAVQDRYYPADYSTGGSGQTVVQVQSGQTATEVGQRLVTLGVVASVRAFELAAEHSTSSATLEPGFYRMKKQMKATLAYQLLLNPSARIQEKITIPEGLRLTQIQAQLGAHSGIPLADYQTALKSPAALDLPSYANGKPEGYLFPATYDVQPNQTATDVLKSMVDRFNQEAESDNLTAAAAAAHLTPGQVITVASLVQAEGGSTTYYSRIARVIYNRLNSHMKLQLDSTVMYGLNTFGIIASNQQLQSNSPYNTYKFAGLPPGPIDSPGHAAIEAALHPASGNDLYFVTTNPKTGLTQFTSSQTQFAQFRQELEHNLGK
jgi:UPF0755 protein